MSGINKHQTDIQQTADAGSVSAEVVDLQTDILDRVKQWLDIRGIEKVNQGIFNACLIDINKQYICNIYTKSDKLDYSYDQLCIIKQLAEVYCYLCYIYNRLSDIYSFSLFSGIDCDTLYRWRDDGKASRACKEIINKIISTDDMILTGRAADGIGNTIGAIFLLKNRHGYTDEKRIVHQSANMIDSTDDIAGLLGVNT